MFKTLTFVAIAAVAASTPMQAAAAPLEAEVLTERVPYGDLNLSSDAGARVMLTRLSKASGRVCGGRPMVGAAFHGQNRAWKACRAETLQRAVTELSSPHVTRLYADAYPQTPVQVARR